MRRWLLTLVVLLAAACQRQSVGATPSFQLEEGRSPANIQYMLDHTVQIHALCGDGVSLGTGVLVSPTLVVTAKHVGGEGCITTVENDLGTALVLGRVDSSSHDLAKLTLSTAYKIAPVGFRRPRLGAPLFSVSYPEDRMTKKVKRAVTDGIVAAFYGKKYVRVTSPISPGSSGGGIWSPDGALLGLTVASFGFYNNAGKYTPYEGYYFVVSSEHLVTFLRSHP